MYVEAWTVAHSSCISVVGINTFRSIYKLANNVHGSMCFVIKIPSFYFICACI